MKNIYRLFVALVIMGLSPMMTSCDWFYGKDNPIDMAPSNTPNSPNPDEATNAGDEDEEVPGDSTDDTSGGTTEDNTDAPTDESIKVNSTAVDQSRAEVRE